MDGRDEVLAEWRDKVLPEGRDVVLPEGKEEEKHSYFCSLCDQTFESSRKLYFHTRYKHSVASICNVCGKQCPPAGRPSPARRPPPPPGSLCRAGAAGPGGGEGGDGGGGGCRRRCEGGAGGCRW